MAPPTSRCSTTSTAAPTVYHCREGVGALCLSMGHLLLTTYCYLLLAYLHTCDLLLATCDLRLATCYHLLCTCYSPQVGALPLDGPWRLPRGARAAATAKAATGALYPRRLRVGPGVSRAAASCPEGAAPPERLQPPATSPDRLLRPARTSLVPTQVVPQLYNHNPNSIAQTPALTKPNSNLISAQIVPQFSHGALLARVSMAT